MLRYPIVLLDLDGTVLDTIDMIIESLAHALATHLNWRTDRATLVSGVGTRLRDQLMTHARSAGTQPSEALVNQMVDTYRAHNLAIHDERAGVFPSTQAAIKRMRGAGVRLAVVTSKPHELARRGLRLHGLEDAFEWVVGSDDVSRHKPHPEPVHRALTLLGSASESAVFVGDSPHDIEAGHAAGVATAAATWGPFSDAELQAAKPTHWPLSLNTLASIAIGD